MSRTRSAITLITRPRARMRRLNPLILIVCALLAAPCAALAQNPKPSKQRSVIRRQAIHASPIQGRLSKQQTAQLETLIPRLMAEADIPGLSIAVVRNGQIAWSRGFGVKNSDTKEPVDDNTVFEAASLSKPVFAYAVLKLVDSGKLDLDVPLTKYLPGKYDVGDDPRLEQITARRVLSHTTGFPNWRPRRDDPALKIHFTPGDRFSYSGEGFVYLAKVVEHVTGEPLAAFMKRTVLDPLGMTSSSYEWRDDPPFNYSARKTFQHNSIGMLSGRGKPEKANAAASLHTTANDYARFVCAMLTGSAGILPAGRASGSKSEPSASTGGSTGNIRTVSGPGSPSGQPAWGGGSDRVNDSALVKLASLRLMLTPQISVAEAGSNNINRSDPKLSTTISWGLGWGLEKTDEGMTFWHWGDNGDVKAYVVANVKQKAAVVMFANSATGLSIVPEVVAEALGGQHPSLAWIHIEPYNSPARQMLKAIVKSDADIVLSDYRQRRNQVSSPTAKDQSQLTAGSAGVSPASSVSKHKDQNTESTALTESQMNTIGYQLLGIKRVKDAIAVFKQNTDDFPNAFNTWDSLAEAFMISGDKDSAIKFYKKSLELNPENTNAVEKLKELAP